MKTKSGCKGVKIVADLDTSLLTALESTTPSCGRGRCDSRVTDNSVKEVLLYGSFPESSW